MKLQTTNLINETLQFMNSKPWHYGEEMAELFESSVVAINADLTKRGNNYHLQTAGVSIDMKKQLTSHMTKHFSASAIRDVSEEKAKELKATKFAFDNARKRYGLDKAFEQSTVASGSYITPNAEMYVWLTETMAYALVFRKTEKQRVFQFYKAELLELSNYATKKTVRFVKANERGGARIGSGRKSKQPAIQDEE